jgi:hypothetical protein
MLPEAFLLEVAHELRHAEFHGKMQSDHEAYAVILEEVDEYCRQVMLKKDNRDRAAMLKKLTHIAALAAIAARDLH